MLTSIWSDVRRYPVLYALLGAAVACFPFLTSLDGRTTAPLFHALLIVDTAVSEAVSWARLLEDGEYWRWATPALIHFGWVHLVLNVLIAILFGRPVEIGLGKVNFALVLVFVAVAANVAQALWSGAPYFGGLSGVVFGLVGFVGVMQRRRPHGPLWQLVPPGMVGGLVFMMIIMSTGITGFFGFHIANAAHWGGFLAGVLAALLLGGRCRDA